MSSYRLVRRDDADEPVEFLPGWCISPSSDKRPSLAELVTAAAKVGTDVFDGDTFLVSYCGRSPYWYDDAGRMHQIGSHGWCHDCHKDGKGYVHHLAYQVEFAVLAFEARDDQVLREQCEADGLTPEQYAAEVAGRAVPLHGDSCFAVGAHELGADVAAGLAWFAVDMWDMTTWKVAVPLAEGALEEAVAKAEKLALDAMPRRCYDCKGTRGHSKRCSYTRMREFEQMYGNLEELRAGTAGAADMSEK
jgi:hypothetical protein